MERKDGIVPLQQHGCGGNPEVGVVQLQAMHLRRCLAFMEATGEFVLLAEHVRGVDNVAADELSRGRLTSARIAMQVSDGEQQAVPDRVLELMVTGSENWSDRQWLDLQQFTSERA